MSEVTASIVEEMKSELFEKLDDRENKLNRGFEDATSMFKVIIGFIVKALNWSYLACTVSMVLLIGSTLVEEPIGIDEVSGVTLPLHAEAKNNESLLKFIEPNKSNNNESKPFNFAAFFYFYCYFTVLIFLLYFFCALAKLVNLLPVSSRLKQEREIITRTQFVGDVAEIVEEVLLRHYLIQRGNHAHKGQ